MWRSLAALDAYRRRFESTPDTLTNAILLGTLLVPRHPAQPAARSGLILRRQASSEPGVAARRPRHPPGPKLGELPLARRDVERLRLIIGLQRRLRDVTASAKAQRALTHRNIFRDALTWFEIHGDDPDTVEKWKTVLAQGPVEGEDLPVESPELGRRRRRRRRRRRPAGPVQS